MPAFRFDEVPLRINGLRAGSFNGTACLDDDGHLEEIELDEGMAVLHSTAKPLTNERVLFDMLRDEVLADVRDRYDEWVRCERADDRAAAYADARYDDWAHEAA